MLRELGHCPTCDLMCTLRSDNICSQKFTSGESLSNGKGQSGRCNSNRWMTNGGPAYVIKIECMSRRAVKECSSSRTETYRASKLLHASACSFVLCSIRSRISHHGRNGSGCGNRNKIRQSCTRRSYFTVRKIRKVSGDYPSCYG